MTTTLAPGKVIVSAVIDEQERDELRRTHERLRQAPPRPRPVTDPSDHRLFSGTIEDQREARREYGRHSRIRRIVNSEY